eukprot:11162837-Lingulodinium_polyedra.AAC.1
MQTGELPRASSAGRPPSTGPRHSATSATRCAKHCESLPSAAARAGLHRSSWLLCVLGQGPRGMQAAP